MKNKTLAKWGAAHALGVLGYILLLAIFMSRANDWFGAVDHDILSPLAALMLFLLSALITGGLVLGKPIMLYLDGQKKDGVKLLLFTGLALFILTCLVFFVLLLSRQS